MPGKLPASQHPAVSLLHLALVLSPGGALTKTANREKILNGSNYRKEKHTKKQHREQDKERDKTNTAEHVFEKGEI